MAHIDVLLREDVENLGHRGQVVRVRAGYGRNYLLPQGLATEATAGSKRMIEEQQRVLAKREAREKVSAQSEATKLDGMEVRFERKVGDHGALYGSVTAVDIHEALKAQGVTVERRKIVLKEPIKQIGEYSVVVKLHREISPAIKVLVKKEGADEEVAAEAAAAPEATEEAVSASAPEEAVSASAQEEATEE